VPRDIQTVLTRENQIRCTQGGDWLRTTTDKKSKKPKPQRDEGMERGATRKGKKRGKTFQKKRMNHIKESVPGLRRKEKLQTKAQEAGPKSE